ncbi:hypothetical protein FACS189493_0500 [Spirochaetia bacterium]|nr:hypothetical protein FACS189493_0500 [Spirochaetia bacterium]
MKKSRFFCLLVCVPAFWLVLTTSVFAAPAPASDFKYDLNSEGTGVVIQQYTGRDHTSVEIPATIEGFPVVELGNEAFAYTGLYGRAGSDGITSVVIPDSVTKIGAKLFYNGALTRITLSKNITVIPESAFEQCELLTAISIPSGVTTIGAKAFYRCMNLTTVSIPASVTSIGQQAFSANNEYSAPKITTITIPAGVTIGVYAFGYCSSLTTVTISEGVTLRGGVFNRCTNLTTLNLPDANVTFAGMDIFNGCTRLSLAARGKLKALGYEGGY